MAMHLVAREARVVTLYTDDEARVVHAQRQKLTFFKKRQRVLVHPWLGSYLVFLVEAGKGDSCRMDHKRDEQHQRVPHAASHHRPLRHRWTARCVSGSRIYAGELA